MASLIAPPDRAGAGMRFGERAWMQRRDDRPDAFDQTRPRADD